MLSWCCGMVESLVIGAYVINHLQAHHCKLYPSK